LNLSGHRAIAGAIVVADVVLREQAVEPDTSDRTGNVRRESMQPCRDAFAEHKVPAAIRVMRSFDVRASSKLARSYA
jgi:hypothetical protein